MNVMCMADGSWSSCFLLIPNLVKRGFLVDVFLPVAKTSSADGDKVACLSGDEKMLRCLCCNRESAFLIACGFMEKEEANRNPCWCELGTAMQSKTMHRILWHDFVFLIVPGIVILRIRWMCMCDVCHSLMQTSYENCEMIQILSHLASHQFGGAHSELLLPCFIIRIRVIAFSGMSQSSSHEWWMVTPLSDRDTMSRPTDRPTRSTAKIKYSFYRTAWNLRQHNKSKC